MAWTKATENSQTYQKEVGITLPSSASTAYSSEIDFARYDLNKEERKVTVFATASAVSGTNIDIALYGAWETGGTKYLLLDAVVADLDSSNLTRAGTVDLNAYKATYYYIAYTVDADESANTISFYVSY